MREKLRAAGNSDSEESLSRLALNVIASVDGLSCSLAGMRRASYVDDAFGITVMEQEDGLAVPRGFN